MWLLLLFTSCASAVFCAPVGMSVDWTELHITAGSTRQKTLTTAPQLVIGCLGGYTWDKWSGNPHYSLTVEALDAGTSFAVTLNTTNLAFPSQPLSSPSRWLLVYKNLNTLWNSDFVLTISNCTGRVEFSVPRWNYSLKQPCSNWCWSTMASKLIGFYETSGAPTPCALEGKLGGANCCASAPCSGACDTGATWDQLASAIRSSGVPVTSLSGALGLDQVPIVLSKNRPILVGITWSPQAGIAWDSSRGHVVALTGYRNRCEASTDAAEVLVDNPSPGVAATWINIKSLPTYNGGVWTNTIY
jgi:hypothetical protein